MRSNMWLQWCLKIALSIICWVIWKRLVLIMKMVSFYFVFILLFFFFFLAQFDPNVNGLSGNEQVPNDPDDPSKGFTRVGCKKKKIVLIFPIYLCFCFCSRCSWSYSNGICFDLMQTIFLSKFFFLPTESGSQCRRNNVGTVGIRKVFRSSSNGFFFSFCFFNLSLEWFCVWTVQTWNAPSTSCPSDGKLQSHKVLKARLRCFN